MKADHFICGSCGETLHCDDFAGVQQFDTGLDDICLDCADEDRVAKAETQFFTDMGL